MNNNISEECYQQEVEELTDLLRNDIGWSDLKNVLSENGFYVNDILLASFIEDDEENEYGLLVTKEKKIYEYARSITNEENNENYFTYKELTKLEEAFEQYPQLNAAFKMIDSKR